MARRVLAAVTLIALAWSAFHAADYATWFFELFLGLAGVGVLLGISRRFTFSPLVYYVVAVHFVVLAVGAKYTYAEVPLFNWLRDTFDLSRNHFDRVGHFAQGFTPALVAREILQRRGGLQPGRLLQLVSISVAVAFSALYEILEWLWVVAFYGDRGPEWLGMQGDPWDAQADMLMALCGALMATLLLGRLQDRQIADLGGAESSERV